jgi:hypothetical protein
MQQAKPLCSCNKLSLCLCNKLSIYAYETRHSFLYMLKAKPIMPMQQAKPLCLCNKLSLYVYATS